MWSVSHRVSSVTRPLLAGEQLVTFARLLVRDVAVVVLDAARAPGCWTSSDLRTGSTCTRCPAAPYDIARTRCATPSSLRLLPRDRSQNTKPTPHASEDSTDSAASSTNISRSPEAEMSFPRGTDTSGVGSAFLV